MSGKDDQSGQEVSRIYVRATPNASKARVETVDQNHLRVYVTVAPEDGKANKAITQLLAKHFKTPASKIRLLAGGKTKNKVFIVEHS